MMPSNLDRNARPRLLYVATDAMTVEFLMKGQLAWMAARGFDVAVAACGAEALARAAEREGVRAFEIPFVREISPRRDLVALAAMLRCLKSFRPHIINAGTPKASLLGLSAGRIVGVPSRIYLQRGLRLETARGAQKILLRICERTAAACAHHVVCVSPSLKNALVAERIIPESKLRVLGPGSSNGIDLQRFADRDALRQQALQLRDRYGIPRESPVVGFIGRLTRDKGLSDLANVYFEVARHLPHAHLVIVGPEEHGDPAGAATMSRLREDSRVHFVGRQADVARWHRLFDVLAFPSRREGLPNVPLEAAASECPVVAYRATGTVDVVNEGETGRLANMGDWRQMAQDVREYLASPALRESHGRNARAFVAKNFDRDLVWNRWLAFYQSELERIGMPVPSATREFTSALAAMDCQRAA